MKNHTRACLVLAALSCSADPALAQLTVSGSVSGYVLDEQALGVSGALVAIAGPDVAGARQATTDDSGFYQFVDLPPGTYALNVSRAGFAGTGRDVAVRSGRGLRADLTLIVGPVTEHVDVAAEPPLLDTKTVAVGVNVSGELQSALPGSSGNWDRLLSVVPGVVLDPSGTLPYVHGAHLTSHVVQLDGVDVGPTFESSPSLIGLSVDALQDVQVKTAAVDASAPLGVGAIISMASRSGSNLVGGTGSFTYRPRLWNDNNNPGGTTSDLRTLQPEVSIGGPVQRDRWWFFGAYRHERDSFSTSRSPELLATLAALEPGFVPYRNENSAHVSYAKVTGRLTPSHELYAFHQRDRRWADFGGPMDAIKRNHSGDGGSAVAVGLSSAWRSVLSRVVLSFNDKASDREPLGRAPYRVVYRSAVQVPVLGRVFGTGPIAFLGSYPELWDGRSRRWTVSGDFSLFPTSSRHEPTVGVYIDRRHIENVNIRSNGGFVQEQLVLRDPANPAAGALPFHRLTLSPLVSRDVLAQDTDVAVYVQDRWRATSRLTLSVGVRIDFIDRHDGIFDVQTQRSTEIGPRLGASYLLRGDNRSLVRGSWSRVHDLLSLNSIPIGGVTSTFLEELDTDFDGVFETRFETPGATRLSDALVLDPTRGQPHVDEWTIGYSRQLPWQVAFDATVIRRAFRDRTAFVDVNGIYEDGMFLGYRNPAVNEIHEVTGNRWNWPVYSALEFQVTRQAGSVQVVGGYTRGFQHVAGSWQPRDPASFIQPSAFPNDAGIVSVAGPKRGAGQANSLNTFAGLAPEWRRHVARVGAMYVAPWNLRIAAVYGFQSGQWSGPILTRLDAPDLRFGRPRVTLENGRVVQNPLSTLVRFAYPTQGEGQFTAEGVHSWDIRIGRAFPFRARTAELLLDVFNVLNLGAEGSVLFDSAAQYSPNYRKTRGRQPPRAARLLARIAF